MAGGWRCSRCSRRPASRRAIRSPCPAGQPAQAVELAAALEALGPVLRLRNGDLWDALGTAILRQVIRASQSKHLYRTFCATHGAPVQLPDGGCRRLFPSWERVLTLTDDEFSSIGLAFKRRPLRAAAREFAQHGARWSALPADALLEELLRVPGIGPWTAGAAVADWTNDWRLYRTPTWPCARGPGAQRPGSRGPTTSCASESCGGGWQA